MVHGGGGGESVLDRLVFGAPEQAGAAGTGDAAARLCAVPAAGPAAAATLRTVTAGLIHRRWWWMISGRPKGLPPTSKKMIISNITASSTKADIIDASMEIIETQSEQITALQERQSVLLVLVGVLSVLLLLQA